MLRRLEMDNVALPELRQLKQEHTYLEKLRQQRTKVILLSSRLKNLRQSMMLLRQNLQIAERKMHHNAS